MKIEDSEKMKKNVHIKKLNFIFSYLIPIIYLKINNNIIVFHILKKYLKNSQAAFDAHMACYTAAA